MAADIDGAGVVTGGDDGRVARTDAGGEVSVLAEFPGRQADVLAVSPSGGLRAAAGLCGEHSLYSGQDPEAPFPTRQLGWPRYSLEPSSGLPYRRCLLKRC